MEFVDGGDAGELVTREEDGLVLWVGCGGGNEGRGGRRMEWDGWKGWMEGVDGCIRLVSVFGDGSGLGNGCTSSRSFRTSSRSIPAGALSRRILPLFMT